MTQQQKRVSTGGKVCMFVGAIFLLGAIFMVANPFIALFALIAGISCMVQGYNMKASEPKALPTKKEDTTKTYYYDNNSTKDRTSKGAIGTRSKSAV